LVVVAVVLDGQTLRGGLPVAADGELLRVVRRPDLDLLDIIVTETSGFHLASECLAIAVVTFTTEEEVFLATNKDFEIRNEVSWEVTTAEIALDLGEDRSQGLGLDVLGSIHTEAAEANANEVSHVGCNTLADVVILGV